MAPKYKGRLLVRSVEYGYDQDKGDLISVRETGHPSIIDGAARNYANQGYDVVMSRDGTPYADLVATKYQVSAIAPYVIRWSIDTQTLEKNLFTHPSAQAEIESFASSPGRYYYRVGIEKALQEGAALESSYFNLGTTPFAFKILQELQSGVQSWECEYTTLTRMVTFDFKNAPTQDPILLRLNSNRNLYSTAQLIADENIPADIIFELPTTVDGPLVNTKWAWRLSAQSAEITNSISGSHTTSWVYAMWSTFLYNWIG